MAALITKETGQPVKLVPGGRGIFEVSIGAAVVARKTLDGFPTEAQCVEAVRAALPS